MDRHPPPAHLADLSIIQVLETHGRERRYRVFTLGGYTKLIAREGFEQPSGIYSAEDIARAGGFIQVHESDFYETQGDLEAFLKRWNGARINKIKDSANGNGKKRKNAGEDMEPKVSKKKWVNPILPDGTRKKGRPLKKPNGVENRGRKKKIDTGATDQMSLADDAIASEEHAHNKRKRADTGPEESEAEVENANNKGNTQEALETHIPQESPKRKRGRPPKKKFKRSDAKIASPSAKFVDGAELTHTDSSVDIPKSFSDTVQSQEDFAKRSTPDTTVPSTSLAQPPSPRESLHLIDPSLTSKSSDILYLQDNTQSSKQSSSALTPASAQIASPVNGASLTEINQAPDDNLPLNFTPEITAPATYDIPSCPTALLDSLAALQGASPEAMAQPGFSDEVTKMIASLAAQVNETLSSSLPINSDLENQSAQTLALSVRSNAGSITAQPDILTIHEHDANPRTALLSEASLSEIAEPAFGDATVNGLGVASTTIPFTIHGDSSSAVQTSTIPHSGSVRRVSSRFEHKTNLTAMRRENELVQLIEDSGGVVNTSTKEFLMAYSNFIEATIKAGEVASAPVGTKMDRRTLNYSLEKLEAGGRVKIITTNLPATTGGYRSSKFAYLPSVSEENLRKFIAEHGCDVLSVPRRQEQVRERAVKEIELDPHSSTGLAHQWLYSSNSQEVYQERWHRNSHRAEQLFKYSDDVVREAMLLEKQTLSQLYGFLTGKVMRARELHLQTIKCFDNASVSSFVACTEPRIVSWNFFENDLPLGAFCACFASSIYSEDIKNSLATSEGRNRPLRDVSAEWKQILQLGRARSRDRIFDLLDYLRSLQLAIPLRKTTSESSPGTQDVDHEQSRPVFEVMPSDWASKVPLVRPEFWQFNTTAPIYLFALQTDPAPYFRTALISTEVEAIAFWDELKAVCLNKIYAESSQGYGTSLETIQEALQEPYSGERRVATALRRPVSWSATYTLSWYQTQYMNRFVNSNNGATPLEDDDPTMFRLRRISYVLSAPLEVVRDYFETARRDARREITKQKRRNEQKIAENKEAELKLLLVKKGLEAVKNRERTWEAIVEKVHPGLVKGIAAARLRKLRQSYVRGNVIQDNQQWEMQISDAIKAAEKTRSDRNLFPSFSRTKREGAARKTPKADSSQLPPVAQGKSVELLIDMQKDVSFESGATEAIEVSARKKRKSRGKRIS